MLPQENFLIIDVPISNPIAHTVDDVEAFLQVSALVSTRPARI